MSANYKFTMTGGSGSSTKIDGPVRSPEHAGVITAALAGYLIDDVDVLKAAPELAEAVANIVAARSETYKARNGRDVGIQDESGEKMWIVPFDEMLALEAALAKAEGK